MTFFSHIVSEVTTSPTLWAGTNSGQVLAFVLTFSKNEEKRKEDKVEVIFLQYFWKIYLPNSPLFKLYIYKAEKILKGSMDLISSPSPSVKLQIMGSQQCFAFTPFPPII